MKKNIIIGIIVIAVILIGGVSLLEMTPSDDIIIRQESIGAYALQLDSDSPMAAQPVVIPYYQVRITGIDLYFASNIVDGVPIKVGIARTLVTSISNPQCTPSISYDKNFVSKTWYRFFLTDPFVINEGETCYIIIVRNPPPSATWDRMYGAGSANPLYTFKNNNWITENCVIGYRLHGTIISAPAPNVPNSPPAVEITSPVNGATFTEPATITVNVQAGDTDGYISKTEVYCNNQKVGEEASNLFDRWAYIFSNVLEGTYDLFAKAYDNDNAVTVSNHVTITVTSSGTDSGDQNNETSGLPPPSIPGFEFFALLVALVISIFILRHKK